MFESIKTFLKAKKFLVHALKLVGFLGEEVTNTVKML